MQRGAVNKKTRRRFIGAHFPEDLVRALDALVRDQDSDRAKVLREAVRAEVARRRGLSALPA